MGKGEARPDRDLRRDDAVAAVESFLAAEHVHRAALALGVPVLAAGELGHDAFRVHATGEHVTVITIAGDDGIARPAAGLEADDYRFLADVEMAKAADEAHAVKLA